MNCFFSGIGKTKTVMVSSLVTMTVNVAVNYILILGKFGCPSLGITGAAIGTITGNACGLLVVAASYFLHFHRGNRFSDFTKSLGFDKEVMKKLLKFGSPGGLEFFLEMIAFDIIILVFHSYGSRVAAAVTIAFNWDLVSFIPLIGMYISVASLVGRFMGAQRPDLAQRTVRSALKLTSCYGVCMFFLFVVFPAPLSALFIHEPENNKLLLEVAQYMVSMVALYVIAHGFHLVFLGALKGAGDTFWSMVITIVCNFILVAESVLMIKVFTFSPEATWAVFVFTMPVIALTFFLRYKSGKWRKIEVIGRDG